MKIKTKNTRFSKRALLLLLAILIIATGASVYYLYYSHRKPTDTYKPQYPVSNTEKKSEPSTKQDIKSDHPTLQEVSQNVPKSDSGSITIVDLNQRDGFVNVSVSTSNFSTTRCVYQFTSDGARPVIKEFEGNCQATSIPQIEFEKIGTYTFTATAYDASGKLTTTKEIDIK